MAKKPRGVASLLPNAESPKDEVEHAAEVNDEAAEEVVAEAPAPDSSGVGYVAKSRFSHGDGNKSHFFEKGQKVVGLDQATLENLCKHGLVEKSQ